MSKVKILVASVITVGVLGAGAVIYTGNATAAPDGHSEHHAASQTAVTSPAVGDPYPLTTCPVSDAELGSMGDPIILDHNGREIRLCCNGCISKFEGNPDKYLKEVDAQIIAAQQPHYPLETCLVTGEAMGGEMGDPIDMVYNNRLVRFCCKGCIKDFNADPVAYMSKLDAAVVKTQVADYKLDACVVTGEKLGGSMGDPIDYVFANQLVRFCCKGCIKKFEDDPNKYMSQLN